jgi:hypothetical protein
MKPVDALDEGDQQGGRPAEHQHAERRFDGAHHASGGTRYTVIECRRSALILINRREFSWPIRSNDFEVRARLSRWSKPILLRRIQA